MLFHFGDVQEDRGRSALELLHQPWVRLVAIATRASTKASSGQA